MDPKEKEEELLKSVALQTANAVLAARSRADQELIQIKEALERKSVELTHSLSMLSATSASFSRSINSFRAPLSALMTSSSFK
jgi:hypothetical protein